MSLENLFGGIIEEAMIVGDALRQASIRKTAHPDDRKLWTPDNPTYGHCDIYTEYARLIWGKDIDGHWNSEAYILVWWVYKDIDSFDRGIKKNKLTVHYSFEHPKYGEIDLSQNQFPDNTYLHPRPKPLTHAVPVGRSWDRSSEMTKRKELFETVFIESLLDSHLPQKITPELRNYFQKTGKNI